MTVRLPVCDVISFEINLKHERIIIHCGTNDLKNNTPESIADKILSLAKSSQQENNTVLVSSIVPRKDHLDKKDKEVSIILEKRCNEMNFAFISHVTLGRVTIAIMTACI